MVAAAMDQGDLFGKTLIGHNVMAAPAQAWLQGEDERGLNPTQERLPKVARVLNPSWNEEENMVAAARDQGDLNQSWLWGAVRVLIPSWKVDEKLDAGITDQRLQGNVMEAADKDETRVQIAVADQEVMQGYGCKEWRGLEYGCKEPRLQAMAAAANETQRAVVSISNLASNGEGLKNVRTVAKNLGSNGVERSKGAEYAGKYTLVAGGRKDDEHAALLAHMQAAYASYKN